ncbi:MAG: conjugal transfer protein TraN [Alphaproteobacteria bacterium]|nr:conjugal transfer protein TraN [Alphaproteobacteria bacterium]
MKKLICGFMVFWIPTNVEAMQASFEVGKQIASEKNNEAGGQIKSSNPKNIVPDFQEGVVISQDETAHSFEHLERSEYGRNLRDIHKTRKPYILDDTEPFMTRSEKVLEAPKEEFEGTETIEETSDGYTVETCEECSHEEYVVKARKTKKRYVYLEKPPYIETSGGRCNHGFFQVRITIPVEPEEAFLENGTWNITYKGRTESGTDTYEHYSVNGVPVDMKKTILQNGGPWRHPGSCVMTNPLVQFVVSSPDIIKILLSSENDCTFNWGRLGTATLHHRVVRDTEKHYWILDDACQHYEKLTEQGLCRYVSMEEDPPTDKFWKGKRVRGSWGQTVTYACHSSCKDTCAKLRARGCSREPNPECAEKAGDKCLRWRWKFKCRDRIKAQKHSFSGKNPFCLGGDCIDGSYESDKDMLQAVGALSILEAARKEMDGTKNIAVFKGGAYSCTRFPLSFKDCCGCNGWGVSIGLTNCDSDSKTVGKLRGEGKCVQIGTYCAEHVNVGLAKFCLREKTVFCCFGTKFAKLLQEQGRPQLGMNFGSPQEPNCRGFTPEELSRIDFSKLDLTEITNDIMDQFKPVSGEHFAKDGELNRIREHMEKRKKGQGGTEAQYLQENMKHLTASLKGGRK